MYYAAHFGLPESPFAITPDPRFLYLSAQHREALAHLLYGMQEGGGFVQLTGDVGTGKTTVCRALLEQLPEHVDVALVLNPALTAHELLQTVCEELLIDVPTGCDSTKVLIDRLNNYLLDANARGRRTVLIIDEAQNLGKAVLEQVRLLTNLETNRSKLLQVFLIGQPELGVLLNDRELRQVAQRITARYHLGPLTRTETREYVRHRLAVAGCNRELYTDTALERIYGYSRGIPRVINILCDRALLGAYAGSQARVSGGIVRRAYAELSGAGPPRRRWWKPAIAMGGAACLVLAAWVGADRWSHQSPAPAKGEDTFGNIEYGAAELAVADPPVADMPSPATEPPPEPPAGTLGSDRRTAVSVLLARWGVPPLEQDDVSLCGWATTHGLRCLQGTGDWQQLQRLNRPALLTIRGDDGEPAYAVLTRLTPQTATLDAGADQRQVSVQDLDRIWSRDYLILWRPPLPGVGLIQRGTSGPAVLWLRQALGRVEGYAAVDLGASSYDAALQSQVMRFQRSRQISVDGVAGPETIIHVNTALRDPTIPLLWMPPTV
jgi:general secretion pathway protein A